MELSKRIYNGDRAREVLENEEFTAAFDAIQQEVMNTWKNSPARDQEGREKCYDYLRLMEKFKAHLQTTLETGKLAQLDLQHQRTVSERVKDAFSTTWHG